MDVNRFLTVNEFSMLVVNGQVLFKTACYPLLLIPTRLRRQGDRTCREEELVSCASVLGVVFVNWVRIYMLIRDVADGVHVDKDDLDVGGR